MVLRFEWNTEILLVDGLPFSIFQEWAKDAHGDRGAGFQTMNAVFQTTCNVSGWIGVFHGFPEALRGSIHTHFKLAFKQEREIFGRRLRERQQKGRGVRCEIPERNTLDEGDVNVRENAVHGFLIGLRALGNRRGFFLRGKADHVRLSCFGFWGLRGGCRGRWGGEPDYIRGLGWPRGGKGQAGF